MIATKDNVTGRIDSEISATTVFGLLANERRQHILQYLTGTIGPVTVADIADQLTQVEGQQYEQHYTSLLHVHLPKLAEAGVIRYDPEQETVERRRQADQITPYLELAGLTIDQ